MMRTCDADDVSVTVFGGEPCGRTYDDVDHLTYCPHDPLPPKLTDAERNAQLDELFGRGYAEELTRRMNAPDVEPGRQP